MSTDKERGPVAAPPVAADPAEDRGGPRALVPSEREQRAGKPAPAYQEPVAPQAEMARGDAVKQYFTRLDPRTMTGGQSGLPLFLLVLTGSFGAIEGQGLGLLFPEIKQDLRISLVTLTTMVAALAVLSTLLGPVAGYIGDRVNRTRMLVVSNAGFGIGTILMTLAHTPLPYFGLQAARNIVSAPSLPVSGPLLADYYPPETRGRIFSFQYVVTSGAGFIGLAMVGLIGDRYGWRPTYVALAIPALLVGFVLLLLKEPKRGGMDGASGNAGEPEVAAPGLVETLRICGGIKTLRRLWYAQPLIAFGGAGIYILLFQYLAQNLHVPVSSRAAISGVATVGGIVGAVVLAPVIDTMMAFRPGRVLSLIGSLLIIDMVLYLSMSLVPSVPYVVAVIVVLGFINAPTGSASLAIETTVIPARVRTLGMQLKPLFGLVGLLFVPILAAVAEQIGFAAAFAIAAPFYFIGGAIVISAGGQVEADLRAARAANAAADEAAKQRRGESRKFLICRDVDVEYDGVRVLFHVDFDVEEGELVALLGTNGAGKSTLLRAITGLTEAANGAIFLDGDDITHTPPYDIARRGVVLMPGGRGVFPGMSVAENLDLAGWITGSKETSARRERVLKEFFPVLRDRMAQKAGSLSGGEQQMLSLAQAFIMDARLLLIDELSLGLAPAVVEQLLAVLREIRAGGTTVLMVEQSVELALRVADRAVFMEKGEVRFSGPAAELRMRQDLLRSVFLRGGASTSMGGGRRKVAGDSPRDAVLEARGVTTSYGGVRALEDVSLRVGRDEIVGIIGPNGAGKTTLFDALSGFLKLDGGEVIFAGRDVSLASPDGRARMGLTRAFQDSSLFPTLTVRETLMVALEKVVRARYAVMTATWTPAARQGEVLLRRRVDRLIEMFGLGAYADRFVVELSTGTRRILGMAVVVATEPDVVLLDEPSSGLAQTETEEMGPLLRRVQQEAGCGLLVIEHDMKLIRAISDRLVAMDLGRVLLEGSPDDVLSDDRVAAAYLGGAIQPRTTNPPLGLAGTAKEDPRLG